MRLAIAAVPVLAMIVTAAWLLGRSPSLWVARDGSVWARGSRLRQGPDGDDSRLSSWLGQWKDRGSWTRATEPHGPEALLIRVESGSDFAYVVSTMSQACQAGIPRVAIHSEGGSAETIEFPRGAKAAGTGCYRFFKEIRAVVCARGNLHNHWHSSMQHLVEDPPTGRINLGVERMNLGPLDPQVRTPMESRWEAFSAAIEMLRTASPAAPDFILDCCPGVPVEVALDAHRAMRRAGAPRVDICVWNDAR